MNRKQLSTIGLFSILFAILYFGFDTKPKKLELIEKSRALKMNATDVSILRKEAFEQIGKSDKGKIQLLSAQLENAQDTTEQVFFLKELSGAWYKFGYPSIAGHYAEQVAEVENTDEAWGIAATTYVYGIGGPQSEKEKKFCKERAMNAFEVAISLDPDDLKHQINRAVLLADHPDEDNPMKGIQLMLELNKNHPQNVSVLNHLAKFGMQTNQLDKALGRLQKVLGLEPENARANCLMAELLQRKNDLASAEVYLNKCNTLRNTELN